MMRLIWPQFASSSCDEAMSTGTEEMAKRFYERFVKLFADFFLPLECVYDFRVSMRNIVKPSSVNL